MVDVEPMEAEASQKNKQSLLLNTDVKAELQRGTVSGQEAVCRVQWRRPPTAQLWLQCLRPPEPQRPITKAPDCCDS